MGYRWYDCKNVAVAYPFGFGLSYARFEYRDLEIHPTAEGFDVKFELANTSDTDAEEVVQVYVSRPLSHIERPVKELKHFRRVRLGAGESIRLTDEIPVSDLAFWGADGQKKVEPGEFQLWVAGDSASGDPVTFSVR